MRLLTKLVDNFKPVDKEMIQFYQNKLPQNIKVGVSFDETKKVFWAEVYINDKREDLIFTKAKTRELLEDSVNDAVVTYFEIPYKYSNLLLINKLWNDPSLFRDKVSKVA